MRSRTKTSARLLLALTLGLAAIGVTPTAGPAQEAPTTGTFRALSYNVAGLPAQLSGSEPHINMPYISPLLNGYDLGFSVARTTFAPGVEVDVYNLHAEAGNTAVDIEFRAEDFEVLAAYINEHSAGRPVIVGGDYNLHTDRPHDAEIYDTFLADAGLTSVCDVVDCGTDLHAIDRFTYRDGGGVTLEPLDHNFERDVFVRPDDGVRLSDHDAVRVDFRWTAQAQATTTTTPGSTTTEPDPTTSIPEAPGATPSPGTASPARVATPVRAVPDYAG